MASKETWESLHYFKKDSTVDKWGDPNAINDILLLALDDFRNFIGLPIYITAGVKTSGHKSKSYHYRNQGACAADVIIPAYGKGAVNLILEASRFGFTGIGYYPHWKYAGHIVGGLHLDMRPLKWDDDKTKNYMQSRWIGVPTTAYVNDKLIKKTEYIPMNNENIIKSEAEYGRS